MPTNSLDLYWDLASLDASQRLKAAQSLSGAFQKAVEGGLHEDQAMDSQEPLKDEISYGLRRLLRGLPSSRDGARQGFAVALAELLTLDTSITIGTVLDILESEQREMLFGKLFGIRAILLSGMIVRDEAAPEEFERICDVILYSLAGGITSVEQLWLVIHMQYKHSFRNSTKFDWSELLPLWKKPADVLHSDNRTMLAEVMKPPRILDFCVDEPLMSSSHERKYTALLLFEKLLPRLESSDIGFVFSPRMLSCLVTSLGQQKTYLHKISKSVVKQITTISEANPEVCLQVIVQLNGKTGNMLFDKIAKSGSGASLTNSLSPEGLEKYVDLLISKFLEPEAETGDDELRPAERQRVWILDQLLSFVKNKRVTKTEELLFRVCKFLGLYAVYTVTKSFKLGDLAVKVPTPALPENIQKQCGVRLLSILGEVSSGQEKPKAENVVASINNCAMEVLIFLDEVGKNVGKGNVVENFETEEDDNTITEALAALKKLQKALKSLENSQVSSQKVAMSALMSAVALHSRVTGGGFLDILQELVSLQEILFPKAEKKSTKRKSTDENEEGLESIGRLVDVLVSVISEPSHLFRKVSQHVFEVFGGQATEKAIEKALMAKADAEDFEMEEDDPEMEGEENRSDDSDDEDDNDDDNEDDNDALESNNDEALIEFDQSLLQPDIENGEDDEDSDEGVGERNGGIRQKACRNFQGKERLAALKKTAKVEFIHMKLRYCDLVDTFFKINTTSIVAIKTIPKEQDLPVERRYIPEMSQISTCLKEVHAVASRAHSSANVKLCGEDAGKDVSETPKKKGKKSSKSAEVKTGNAFVESFSALLKSFLNDKKSALHLSIFEKPFKAFPAFAAELLSVVLDLLQTDKVPKAFQMSQGFKILSLENKHALAQLSSSIQLIASLLLDVFNAANSNRENCLRGLNADRLKEIVLYSKLMVKPCFEFELQEVSKAWKLEEFKKISQEVIAKETFARPSLRKALSEFEASFSPVVKKAKSS
ncbi:DNA polymerase phi-domain-containing protein [Chytridium lagenaria]|nr:DNA polymerase phi-domain-containing protein [Chytridium lagenaria]